MNSIPPPHFHLSALPPVIPRAAPRTPVIPSVAKRSRGISPHELNSRAALPPIIPRAALPPISPRAAQPPISPRAASRRTPVIPSVAKRSRGISLHELNPAAALPPVARSTTTDYPARSSRHSERSEAVEESPRMNSIPRAALPPARSPAHPCHSERSEAESRNLPA